MPPELPKNLFLVNITILEGRHYVWTNIDSFVQVKVGNSKKSTRVIQSSDCPFYNEYFVFELVKNFEEFLDMNIHLIVYKTKTTCMPKKILGFVNLEVATVWDQPDHQFYRKWAILNSPKENIIGARGYLKVTISILCKGQTPIIPLTNPWDDDKIEGHLLLPEGITQERHKALYIFTIYRGEDIMMKKGERYMIDDGSPRFKEEFKSKLPETYIEINFAGITIKTSKIRKTASPIWNQELTINELFPPLSHRIKIFLCFRHKCTKLIKSKKYLQIKSISNDKINGFLPTFGPSFIHFYKKNKIGEEYVGKILISLETKIIKDQTKTKNKSVNRELVSPIIESLLWNYENVILFMGILNISLIHKKYIGKKISFEVNWGRTKSSNDEDFLNILPENVIDSYEVKTKDKFYGFINFGKILPCLYILGDYPNFRRRFYNANLLNALTTNLKNRLEEIKKLFNHDEFTTNSSEIERKLIDLFNYVNTSCSNFIERVRPTFNEAVTDLDKEKINLSLKELEDIQNISESVYNPRMKKKSFKKAEKIYYRLLNLIDHPQECWPDIFFWIKHDKNPISFIKLSAKDLIYSNNDLEKGIKCGKVSTIYFPVMKPKKFSIPTIAKMDYYIWIGLEDKFHECIQNIPKGYDLPEDILDNEIPIFLRVSKKMIFSCRVFIYQGRFLLASDKIGLSDFYLRVVVGEFSKKTKIIYKTLNPIWNQTISFNNIELPGDAKYIEENPPIIIIDIMDKDRCYQEEYVGRAFVKPFVKFKEVSFEASNSPKLEWYQVKNEDVICGEILIAAELTEQTSETAFDIENKIETKDIIPFPNELKPKLYRYRMEIFFWGIRNLKKFGTIIITKPKIVMQLGEFSLSSSNIVNIKKNLNFSETHRYIDMELPNAEELLPAMSIKLLDSKPFGRNVFIGAHTAFIQNFIYRPITKSDWDKRMEGLGMKSFNSMISKPETLQTEIAVPIKLLFEEKKISKIKAIKNFFKSIKYFWAERKLKEIKYEPLNEIKEEEIDWWTKYYTSLENPNFEDKKTPNKIKIYDKELEMQSEFENFTDTLPKYKLFRGKTTGDELEDSKKIIALLKCKIKIYLWPPNENLIYVTPTGGLLENGIFKNYPSNEEESFVLRIYCIRGIKLKPKDVSGKCDPFIRIKMNEILIDDCKNRIIRNVNPIFGRAFELKGTFPQNHSVSISIWDWDRSSRKDLIGETSIDIENRFYTRHRASCGIDYNYIETGPTAWRDQERPTQILENLCSKFDIKIDYMQDGIIVGCKKFDLPKEEHVVDTDLHQNYHREKLALFALHHWHEVPLVGCHLVPEHVETRSLYHPSHPGIEQGKIQLWIDIFLTKDLPPPPMVEIIPRKPISYELRIIIWNVEEVVLNESDFFGDKKSDIYVKGWITDVDEAQQTDVHYRSLTGEGNFNWRFIFAFDFLSTENKIVIKESEGFLNLDETEIKLPCRLKLQVWDNDIFSKDDFLGEISFDLSKMPLGAKIAHKCNLKMLENNAPSINLFKIRRTRGWWPFTIKVKDTNRIALTGKLEAEFELLEKEEAILKPAGFGRAAPQPLPPPKRPETSFSWFTNPLKTCKYIIWKKLKYKLLLGLIILLLILFLGVGLYNFPKYSVRKLLGV